jgi:hypothetical protein
MLGVSTVRYRAYKSPPMVLVLRQINPIRILLSYFFNIHLKSMPHVGSRSSINSHQTLSMPTNLSV